MIENKKNRFLADPKKAIPFSDKKKVWDNLSISEKWEQKEVVSPEHWTEQSVTIAGLIYFVKPGRFSDFQENSIYDMVDRVVNQLCTKGEWNKPAMQRWLEDRKEYLWRLLIGQYAAFNSPVWFNVGLESCGHKGSGGNYYWSSTIDSVRETEDHISRPQCSACFIQPVDDSITGIFELLAIEARVFKHGSGTGTNFSTLRSRFEHLDESGMSSGVLSFLEIYDAGAGAVKSGGKSRRAAKMVLLDDWHPEVRDFIRWKAREEEKAQILIAGGLEADFNGEAYSTVKGRNGNNSVRLSDKFMEAVETNGMWNTRHVTNREIVHETFPAEDMWNEIAEAAHICADPGVQFTDTINKWNVCADTEPINASNPCSEFLYLDGTACNLSSINLQKFLKIHPPGTHKYRFSLDLEGLGMAIETMIIYMENIVEFASYPSPLIAQRSKEHRPLGLGYSNLGNVMMLAGIPYDSDDARDFAAAITSFFTAKAYSVSGDMAKKIGPFDAWKVNRDSMSRVIHNHKKANEELFDRRLRQQDFTLDILCESQRMWETAADMADTTGFRNSQVTVIAPTGTISFLMGCETTGIEPVLSKVSKKILSGGGEIILVNESVPEALRNTGKFTPEEEKKITSYMKKYKGAFNPEHFAGKEDVLKIFQTSLGTDALSPEAHVDMVAAVTPFVSGAISKTVNIPGSATVEDIRNVYWRAWKKGVKCIAVYRDGSKASQPVSSSEGRTDKPQERIVPVLVPPKGTRPAVNHKFQFGQESIQMSVGTYSDGRAAEVFMTAFKIGSFGNGMLSLAGLLVSKMIQYGIPLQDIIHMIKETDFPPNGFVISDSEIKFAASIPDYMVKYLEKYFLEKEENPPENRVLHINQEVETTSEQPSDIIEQENCYCGGVMVQSGTCKSCNSCGRSTGGCG